MNYLEQHHSGNGDNISGNKIINEIRSLAPADLITPIELVFESLRQNNKAIAKTQIILLRAVAQKEPESAALVEVISIYGGLVEAQDRDAAWSTVARIISRTKNPIIKDVCQAALLQLSRGTAREGEAKDLYFAERSPGEYSQEAYLRYYADEDQIRSALGSFPAEGVLTGAVEGAFRLPTSNLALELATRLNLLYGSYNARVLLAIATGLALNPDLAQHHLWLNKPEVKDRIDELRDMTIRLLDESTVDGRVHTLSCSILEIYQYQSIELIEALKKHAKHLDPNRSVLIARCKALVGDDTGLPQAELDLQAAFKDPQKRQEWCRRFLEEKTPQLEDVGPFIKLANPTDINEWLSRERLLVDASEMEEDYARLVANIFRRTNQDTNPVHRHEISEHVTQFINKWEGELHHVDPTSIFRIAERLLTLNLPHMALKLTTHVMPSHELWPSPYVVTHLRCLQEARQNKTFEDLIARVKGADQSADLLNLQSVQAERGGNIDLAISLSRTMIDIAPEWPFAWYRHCNLLNRYSNQEEQRLFHDLVPDSILVEPSHEVKGILFFLTLAGSFKRAESLWIKWMIEDPRGHAVDLVNFHFSLVAQKSEPLQVSSSVERYLAAFHYTHEGDTLIRLIVDDELVGSEYTLKSSSQVGQLLQRLSPGESENLHMASYTVLERLPPYVGCLRIALNLRHANNDGSDCFVKMEMPSNPDEIIPFLEKKLGGNSKNHEDLQTKDAIPLYLRGHALYRTNAFRGAMNCWTNQRIPKPQLCNIGNNNPHAIVLDAYGISYLSVINIVKNFLELGITLVVPAATKERLEEFLTEITDEHFMLLGVTDDGRLFRTTASDLRIRDAHILENLRIILNNITIASSNIQDDEHDVFSIKDAVDETVYDAMQLSVANTIPWLCMDEMLGALHNVKGHPLVNIQELILKAQAIAPFDFEKRRHALLFYALNTIPLPITFQDIYHLSRTPNTLAGFILFSIIKNHGRKIFAHEGRSEFLLQIIHSHLRQLFGKESQAVMPTYSPAVMYTSHVFNHGLNLYLTLSSNGSAEFRVATAAFHMFQHPGNDQSFMESLVDRFINFTEGHFMSWNAIEQHLISMLKVGQPLEQITE